MFNGTAGGCMIFEFFVYDDPELYTWHADTWAQAQTEICREFEITPTDIENHRQVPQ